MMKYGEIRRQQLNKCLKMLQKKYSYD
ncbi:hypothetical protein Golob_000099 [Gossypium lobatum]|uniref:Uncharacterized protein n=1 Tax=Gossypium lobatum TaxID=34289 RepID=A0A7J8NF48_9ROSI|nr:hypothetical protein [Gossypium lobatum]